MGGFCQSCQKEVVDFRGMSYEEILLFISKNSKNSCGIFRRNQIESESKRKSKHKRSAFWILSFLGMIGLTHPVHPATFIKTNQEQTSKITALSSPDTTSPDKRIVRGKILSGEDKLTLPGATVWIKGTRIASRTDQYGEFEIEIPDSIKKNKIKLIFSFVGFQSVEKKIKTKDGFVNLGSIYLQEDDTVLGPFGLDSPKKSLWNQITRYFKKETSVVNS
jgi:hypothetical protein